MSVRLSMLRHLVVIVRPLRRLTPPDPSWCLLPGSGVEVVISAWEPEYSWESLSLSSVSWLVLDTLARKVSRWWEVAWLRSVRWDWLLVILDLLEVEGGLAATWDCCLHSPVEEEVEPDLRLRLI